jgi:thiol-disulfide isomerase/thioredoxin
MKTSKILTNPLFNSATKLRSYVAAAMLSVALLGAHNVVQAEGIFPVVGVDGTQADLNSYLKDGKWTLVKVWATWCHVCELQKPVISELHDKHVDGDMLSVVGLSLDGKAKLPEVQANLKKHPVTFNNFVTELDDVFAFNYGQLTGEDFYGTPTYLLFGPDGEIVANRSGMIQAGDIERFIESSSL